VAAPIALWQPLAAKMHFTFGFIVEPDDEAAECRFARAALAHHSQRFARPHTEAGTAHSPERFALRQRKALAEIVDTQQHVTHRNFPLRSQPVADIAGAAASSGCAAPARRRTSALRLWRKPASHGRSAGKTRSRAAAPADRAVPPQSPAAARATAPAGR